MVLLANTPEQLLDWDERIGQFLNEQLGLALRQMPGPVPLRDGLPFLGYRVFASHRTVLRRSRQHCRQVLKEFERRDVRWVQAGGGAYRCLAEHGWLRHGGRRRALTEGFGPCYIAA